MGTLHLKYYSCLRLRFPDVETNPGPRRPVAASCRILCSNVLSGNLSDLTVASSQYDILLSSEILVSDLCHVSELLVPGFGRPVLLYTFAPPRFRTSQDPRTLIPLSVSLWNDLVDPVFDGVGLAGFKSRSNAFLLA